MSVRLSSPYSIPFLSLSICTLALLILKNTIIRWHSNIKKYFNGEQIELPGVARSFHHDKAEMEKTGLITYDLTKNPKYNFVNFEMQLDNTEKGKNKEAMRVVDITPDIKQYKNDDDDDEQAKSSHMFIRGNLYDENSIDLKNGFSSTYNNLKEFVKDTDNISDSNKRVKQSSQHDHTKRSKFTKKMSNLSFDSEENSESVADNDNQVRHFIEETLPSGTKLNYKRSENFEI